VQKNPTPSVDQLRSGCRLRRRDDQTVEELVNTEEWKIRNEELGDMYNALTGQAMDCLLRPIDEDEVLADEDEVELDDLLQAEIGS
jgi:hypothetical protein